MFGNVWTNEQLVSSIQNLGLPVVVVNQDPGKFTTEQIERRGSVLVVNTPETGLSRSRNLLLKYANFDFAILCDDDVHLDEEQVKEFGRFLISSSKEAIENVIFQTALIGEGNSPWRQNYPEHLSRINRRTFLAWRRLQKINSMELVLNVKWMKANQISFNPSFGLGAKETNGGEEIIMLHDALNAGAQIVFHGNALRIHDGESSGQTMNSIGALTRGRVHRITAPPIWWPPLALRFFFRYRNKPEFMRLFMQYMKGLFQKTEKENWI